MEGLQKQKHVDAFDRANEIATALDPSHGRDFKTAFVAMLLAEAKIRGLTVARELDPTAPKMRAKLKAPDGRLTAAEAADYLGMSLAASYNLKDRGPKGQKHGRILSYAREDLDAFAAR
jgi:hypothetical protein